MLSTSKIPPKYYYSFWYLIFRLEPHCPPQSQKIAEKSIKINPKWKILHAVMCQHWHSVVNRWQSTLVQHWNVTQFYVATTLAINRRRAIQRHHWRKVGIILLQISIPVNRHYWRSIARWLLFPSIVAA